MPPERTRGAKRRLRRLLPRRVRTSYAAKLGVAFFLVILVIGTVGGALYVQTDAVLAEDTNQELEQSTRLQSETLAQWVGLMKEEARLLSRSRIVKSRDTDRVRTFLTQEVEENGRLPDEVVAIHYVDTSEFVIETSTNPQFVGVSPRERGVPWAQDPPSFESPDQSTVTRPFASPMSGEPVVAIISPVPDQPDRVLVVMVNLKERIVDMPRPDGGITHVVNAEGTVVMSHRTDRMLQQNMEGSGVSSPAIEAGLEGASGTTSMSMGGETIMVGYAPVEGTDWVLTNHVPKSEAFALQQTISRNLLLLIVASVLGLGAIGVTVGRNTSRSLEELSSAAATMAEGTIDVTVPESDREDELGRLHGSFAEMQATIQDLLEEVEEERERAEAARADAEALNEHLEEKAEEYGEVMGRWADGDLTARMDAESESEAMVEIGESFNRMVDDWAGMVTHVRRFAREVVAASEQVSTGSRELKRTSEDVSGSIQDITEGASRQSESLKEVANTMNDLSATIEEVAASADEVANTSRQAAETGETGRKAAENAMAAMDEIENCTEQTAREVEDLHDEIETIGEVVELITDIAEQTNLLALNASIEAARAGEAGEGFAVVADEVKTLAEETKEATEEIESSITQIQEKTRGTVEGISEMRESVTEGSETVEQAIDSLERIVEYVEDTNAGVQEISTATDDQAASTQEVVSMIDDVANISERTEEQAETVAAASEEQAATTGEVSDSAEELASKANRLMELLQGFELGESEGGAIDPDSAFEDVELSADGGDGDGRDD